MAVEAVEAGVFAGGNPPANPGGQWGTGGVGSYIGDPFIGPNSPKLWAPAQ